MSRLLFRVALASAVFFAVGLLADAQTSAVSAPSGSLLIGGSPITAGTIAILPVDTNGHPIAVTTTGGGLNLPGSTSRPVGYPCVITGGGVSGCSVPDSALANGGAGYRYNITITDTSVSDTAAYGMSFTLNQVPVTGSSWRLDQYQPTISVAAPLAMQYITGATAPTGPCSAPSQYFATSTATLYVCNGSTASWVAISGPGGGGPAFNGGTVAQAITAPGYNAASATGVAGYFKASGGSPLPLLDSNSAYWMAPSTVTTSYAAIMPGAAPTANGMALVCNQPDASGHFQCSFAAPSPGVGDNIVVGATTSAGYAGIALNGNNSDGQRVGIAGGDSSGGLPTLWLDAPTGHIIVFRIGGTPVAYVDTTGYHAGAPSAY